MADERTYPRYANPGPPEADAPDEPAAPDNPSEAASTVEDDDGGTDDGAQTVKPKGKAK